MLCLNSNKTQCLEFRLRCDIVNVIVPWSFLQPNTKWNFFIEVVSNNTSKATFLLGKLKLVDYVDALTFVYFAHLQSNLMYEILSREMIVMLIKYTNYKIYRRELYELFLGSTLDVILSHCLQK